MIIAILISVCYSSTLIDISSQNNITDLFIGCQLNGENKVHLLFQCKHMNALIPKVDLQNQNVMAYSFNKTKKVYLNNMILSELEIDQQSQQYLIRFSNLLFSGYGDLLEELHSQNAKDYFFYDFQCTTIDGILTIAGLLSKQYSYQYLANHNASKQSNLYLTTIYPRKINLSHLSIFNLTCNQECKIIGYQQCYNSIRNTLIIAILETEILNIFEYSFIDYQFRDVYKYKIIEIIDIDEKPQQIQLYDGYVVIKFRTIQALFSISSILYEIKLIASFSLQPLILDVRYKYILQQHFQFTNLFIIEDSKNWQENQSVRLIEQFDVLYSKAIYISNETLFIFIYDNLEQNIVNLDINNSSPEEPVDCTYNKTYFPKLNLNPIYYQLDQLALSNKGTISDSIEETQLQLLQSYSDCQKPCNILYQNVNVTFVTIDQQCIVKDLEIIFTNYCTLLNECHTCMGQVGCSWEIDKCKKESNPYEVNMTSHEQSSLWYLGKIMKCEMMQQQQQSQLCGYDQIYFNIAKSFSYSGQIRKGQMCSWFYDAQQLQSFQLFITADFFKLSSAVQQSICLGNHDNSLCEHINIDKWDQNGTTGYAFKGSYFRYSILFLEENLANNLTITVQHQAPLTIADRLKQSLIQMLAWLICGILLFTIMGYVAKRRLQFLVAQTIEIELHNVILKNDNQIPIQQHQLPLTNENLDLVMQGLLDQEIVARYPSDPSLLLYGEDSCSFCFELFDVSEQVAQMFCGHVFHYICFQDWIRVKGQLEKCPICNQKVDHFLANKEEYAQIKSQILEKINDSERQTTHLIE